MESTLFLVKSTLLLVDFTLLLVKFTMVLVKITILLVKSTIATARLAPRRAGGGAGSHTEPRDRPYATTSNFWATSTIAWIARSRCSRVWAALIWQRSLAAPWGTTGKPKPET